MDIRQLRYFIAIVEEKKISAAANRLHMSQPPLSQQLKAMEEELGLILIERSGRNLEVTEAGKTLYKNALKITELMENSKKEVKDVGAGINGTLTLGVNTFSVSGLPQILTDFQKKYPLITYKIQQNESAYLCELIRNRTVELSIIRLPLQLDDFSVLHLYEDPFYFITNRPLSTKNMEVSLDDIQQYSLLLPSTEGLGVHYLLLEAFSRMKTQPNIIGECSDISVLMDLVSTGFATAIVPKTLLHRFSHYSVYAYQICESTELTSSVGVIWLKGHTLSKAAENFLQALEESHKFFE